MEIYAVVRIRRPRIEYLSFYLDKEHAQKTADFMNTSLTRKSAIPATVIPVQVHRTPVS